MLNHTGSAVEITGAGTDLLTDRSTVTGLTIPGGGVAVLREQTIDNRAPGWALRAEQFPG